jgi:ABC-type lipoprotein release transport system permease subunit
MNGIEKQVLRGYITLQAGDVAVIWDSLKEVSPLDPGKFLYDFSFSVDDEEQEAENQRAMAKLRDYLAAKGKEIKAAFPTVRRYGQLVSREKIDVAFKAYGLTRESRDFLLQSGAIQPVAGQLPVEGYQVCISKTKADEHQLQVGDWVTIEATTPYGGKNAMDFQIGGIYANAAGYENWYGFMPETAFRLLFAYDPDYFDLVRIYLTDRQKAPHFAQDLDAYLTTETSVLRAESYAEASPFFTNNSRLFKAMFNVFILFLLGIIAIGLRATFRMNLFERMKEFGALRAIGYSRSHCFGIIFCEIFLLALITLGVALLCAGPVVYSLGQSGIYVGSGIACWAVGGERFYPFMRLTDLLFTTIIIFLFSLSASLQPALSLCYQKITDLLAKRQRRLFLPAALWRNFRTHVGLRPDLNGREGNLRKGKGCNA